MKTREDIKKEIFSYLRSNSEITADQPFDDHTLLIETGILDSVLLVKLVSYLEKEFGISLSPEEISPDQLSSLQRICDLVARKLSPG